MFNVVRATDVRLAQLDRAFGYGPKGCGFDSYWAHHNMYEISFLKEFYLYIILSKGGNMITFEDFAKIDIRVGTVLEAELNKKAKKPAYKLKIDFGNEIGIKKTSAQITDYYTPDELIGKQLLAVVNFPPKQIADFISEVLILGTYSTGGVILITPDKKAQNGDKLG